MLDTHRQGGVLRLNLNRPDRHNAFDEALIEQLTRALEEAAQAADLRAVVLAGNGPSFSAGADLGWMRRQADATQEDNLRDALALARLMRTLDDLPVPTIAAVHGSVFGGGVGLVACCDIAIAADTARFGLTEVRLGLLPAVISPYVVSAIGPRQARRWFTTGEHFDAHRAQAMGLVHECVPAEQLDSAVDHQLDLIAQAAPGACSQVGDLVRQMALITDPVQQDAVNSALIATLRAGAEGREGLDAFLSRRKPYWSTASGSPRP